MKKELSFHFLLLIFVFASIMTGCNSNRDKWKYQPFSGSVIQFEFVNDPPSTYFVSVDEDYRKRFVHFTNLRPLKVEKAGIYYLVFGLDLPSAITTQIGEESFQIFIFPDDTSKIIINFKEEGYNLEFGGGTRNINNYLAHKVLSSPYLDIVRQCDILYHRNIEFEEYVFLVDSLVKAEWSYLEKNKSAYKLSRQFMDYEKNRVYYHGLTSKLNKGIRVGTYDRIGRFRRSNDPKPDLYFNLLQKPSYNNPNAIYTDSYYNYISTFIAHTMSENPEFTKYDNIPLKDEELHKIIEFKDLLKGKSRDVYMQDIFIAMAIDRSIQPLFVDSLASIFKITVPQEAYEMRQRSFAKYSIRPSKPGEQLRDFYMSDKNYDLHSIRQFENKILVMQLSNQLSDTSNLHSMIFEKLADDYNTQSDVAFINIYMHLKAEKWLDHMAEHGSDNDFLVEVSWNEALTEMFGIKNFPHYVVIGKGNNLIQSIDHLSMGHRYLLDSLLLDT